MKVDDRLKAGDLVSITGFPPLELGFGASPGPGILAGHVVGSCDPVWNVLLEGKVYPVNQSCLQLIQPKSLTTIY